ncbi:phosphoribosylformimino-5-aminoimidazole carboxamide ribotide isomerase [Anaerosolibacter carboniphilus]|uniref:1-(5-phosphoribosyl)-5-[(5-phosphoribosylamino)methylideneamino] imidazole-4-carboxamide isomerase n=1 Tax=Anaerosolibacter carboniphilus TaxID=1417629 RepID=A0A841KQP6_9FIRM|nr:1-(5-phosphoribosyl)-5-[(5-phosphoribosylamino)methylideneamino]imidazole-4-carboxamide isomerase [Anaerosolibacter carboniphilus]MBB6215671.1 phosphoribosylformimino-5-aminoimidazole carboxamide ribotide isomerase [Anaerosolibacter carboniphilus]
MIIFPAIDIRDGKCVRLEQGRFDKEEIYFDDPIEIAALWKLKGATCLHIVDLDGARYGLGKNKDVIREIIQGIDIPIQVGGGFRTLDDIDNMLQLGAEKVIIGTSAVMIKNFVDEAAKQFGNKIIVSLDAKGGNIAVEGWTKTLSQSAFVFAQELEDKGIQSIVYTDIAKDGMLSGPNFQELKQLKEKTKLNIIASGGITTVQHIKDLKSLGICGAIIGKALYEGAVTLEEIKEVLL